MKKGDEKNPWAETGEIGLLPYDARLRLQKAAATKIPPDDPLARIREMYWAEKWVKDTYPQFFEKETMQ